MGRLDLQVNVCRMMNKLNKTDEACSVDVEAVDACLPGSRRPA
jgi:hypothetical protein